MKCSSFNLAQASTPEQPGKARRIRADGVRKLLRSSVLPSEHCVKAIRQHRCRCSAIQVGAIIKGPIGLSHKDSQKIPIDILPERGVLLPLRKRYDIFANFRPASLRQRKS